MRGKGSDGKLSAAKPVLVLKVKELMNAHAGEQNKDAAPLDATPEDAAVAVPAAAPVLPPQTPSLLQTPAQQVATVADTPGAPQRLEVSTPLTPSVPPSAGVIPPSRKRAAPEEDEEFVSYEDHVNDEGFESDGSSDSDGCGDTVMENGGTGHSAGQVGELKLG